MQYKELNKIKSLQGINAYSDFFVNSVSFLFRFPASGDYEILGRVTYVSVPGDASYEKLLETAKTLYPETTDVVNITVDGAETYRDITTSSISGSSSYTEHVGSTYTMNGIAIHIFGAE